MKEGIYEMDNYADACTEVYTLLKYLKEDEYKKIPHKIIKVIEDNRNPEYIYKYDNELQLKQQEMLTTTKAILFNIFRDYLCTEKQRETIKSQQLEERKKNELKKIELYGSEEIFKKKEKEVNNESLQLGNIERNNISMTEYKQSVFTKIISKIKSLFIRN